MEVSIKKDKEVQFLVIDLFCGFGGTTLGFTKAGNALVIACVNHDPKAIKSHWLNHPEVEHFEEDIRLLDLTRLSKLLNLYRAFYPNAKVILWASLECIHFSIAKGGGSRDADSRTLALHLHRYIEVLDPDYVQIENVKEFRSWGPLRIAENTKKGRKMYADRSELKYKINKVGEMEYTMVPKSKDKGLDWLKWRESICSRGYRDDWKMMNSADYGEFTSRNRLYGIFAKPDCAIAWPAATHSKNPEANTLFGTLKPWNAVKEVLDLDDEGDSFFDRAARGKKPFVEATEKRVLSGCLKFIANGDDLFLQKYFSGDPESKVISQNSPAGTITCIDHHGLVKPIINKNITKNGISVHWIDKQYGGNSYNYQSISSPAGTIATNDKHNMIHANFLLNHTYNNEGNSTEGPAPTLLSSRRHFYLVNPQFDSKGSSIEKPCFTLIAKMDKRPPSIVTLEEGKGAIITIHPEDSPTMVKIKLFMAHYGIVDIKIRQLNVPELLRIQGFPDNYHCAGTQTDAKKFIGNSVTPHVIEAWSRALGEKQFAGLMATQAA